MGVPFEEIKLDINKAYHISSLEVEAVAVSLKRLICAIATLNGLNN